MALEQQHTFDTTKDHHVSKRLKLNPSAHFLDDDEDNNQLLGDDAQEEAADEAVDFALQMLARNQRRGDSL
jgi:hypothetical protein